MIIEVNAMGDTCPIPIVKTKKAIMEMGEPGTVQTSVDNEISVQNLSKMAAQKKLACSTEKKNEGCYVVSIEVTQEAIDDMKKTGAETGNEEYTCEVPGKGVVVAIGSELMGGGDEQLGHTLMKAFIYALSQMDELPAAIIFYNSGAKITTIGTDSIQDLKDMESRGVEILTCGTCLNYYGLAEKLQVGGVSNMYQIVEKLTQASRVVKP